MPTLFMDICSSGEYVEIDEIDQNQAPFSFGPPQTIE